MHVSKKASTKNCFLLIIVTILLSCSMSALAADDSSLLLSCNVKVKNYPGIKDTLYRKEVRLSGTQTTDLGRKKIMDLGNYQLWVEAYAMSLTGKPQILEYIAKIVNTKTMQASIAHSGVHPQGGSGLAATVRQVRYDKSGKHEIGFINLKCLSFGLPDTPIFKKLEIK